MDNPADERILYDSVADIYDSYVLVDFDIPFWLSEAGSVGGNVLELTCGTGRVSIPLLKAGVNLTCVDYAPEMLSRFRRKLDEHHLTCPLICQDIAELSLPDRFDLIFIPFHSFAEITTEDKRRSALARISEHLTARGRFICTLQNPALRISTMDGSERLIGEFPLAVGEKLVVHSRLSFDQSTQLATGIQTYDRHSADGTVVDHRSLAMRFYLIYRHQFETLARDAGFAVVAVYGDYSLAPFEPQTSPFMIFKLRANKTGGDSGRENTKRSQPTKIP